MGLRAAAARVVELGNRKSRSDLVLLALFVREDGDVAEVWRSAEERAS